MSLLLSVTFACGLVIAVAHVLNRRFIAPVYDVVANLLAFACAVAASMLALAIVLPSMAAAAELKVLAGGSAEHPIDAHAIQPYYTSLLAKGCGLSVAMVMAVAASEATLTIRPQDCSIMWGSAALQHR